METKDYYAILGVDKKASAADIKKAYRALAKKYHPDIAGDTPENRDKIKQINEAFDILGDEKKRSEYDLLMDDMAHGRPHFSQNGYSSSGAGSWDDILSQFFNMGGQGARSSRQSANPFEGFNFGGGASGNAYAGAGGNPFAGFNFGGGARGGSDPFAGFGGRSAGGSSAGGRGADVERVIKIPLAEAFAGSKRSIRVEDGKSVEFTVPAGIAQGEKLSLPGLGATGMNGQKGRLLLEIEIEMPQGMRLNGKDLEIDCEVMPWTAALGGTADVRTIEHTLTINIPAGTRSGKKLRIRGQGYRDRKGARGDLYLLVNIQNPERLTGEMKELFRKLADADKNR